MFFSWDILNPEDIRAHHFDILDIIKPMPSTLDSPGYVVIGTGPERKTIDQDAITKLKNYGIKFDVLDTVAHVESVPSC